MIIPPGYAQVGIIWSGSSVPRGAANVLGFRNDTGLDVEEIATLVGQFVLELTPNLPDEIACTELQVKLGPNDNGGYEAVPVELVGEISAGETVAPNTSYLFRKVTSFGGRKNHGRMYLPGVLEGAINGAGDLGSSWIADWNTAANNAMNVLTGGDLPMYLLHGSVTAPTPVLSLKVQSRVATQRRRLRG